jgi:hypothetical protein
MIDPHARLQRVLLALAAPARMIDAHAESWASVTFSGMRHRYRIALDGADAPSRASALTTALAEHEFAIPGHLVADIAANVGEAGDGQAALEIEALTIVEG